MGKILVAYDGSDSSKNALRQAIRLAETEKCDVKVINILLSAEELGVDIMGHGVSKESAEKLLREAETIALNEDGKVETAIGQGIVYKEICKAAESDEFNLVVMGRRGLSRLEKMLMGSVTSRVIGHTDKDVLVVPMDTEFTCKKILVATDGSKYGDAAVGRAIELAKTHGGSILAVSVAKLGEAEEILKNAKKKVEAENMPLETYAKEGDAYHHIIELAKEKKADAIVIGSHGKKNLGKLLMGNVTEKVIGYSLCPVLVVKA